MEHTELGVVHTAITRADPAAVEALAAFGVATVHEAMGRVGLMRPYIRPVYPGAKLCGTAVTVLLQPGDNWMMHVAAEQVRPGDVLVAACTTESEDGFFGDLLATSLQARGAAGMEDSVERHIHVTVLGRAVAQAGKPAPLTVQEAA